MLRITKTLLKPKLTYNTYLMNNIDDYVLHFDGCAKGNPGIAGCGAVLYKNNDEIWCDYKYLGTYATNNEAEYNGLLLGLKYLVENKINGVTVKGDSRLVIKQMSGEFQVKSNHLKPIYNRCIDLSKQISGIKYIHVYRNNNTRADELSNIAVANYIK